MIRATLDLLTMKAFQPDVRNHRIPFGRRDISEPLMGVSVHRSGATLCKIDSGESQTPAFQNFEVLEELHDDELQEAIVQYARKHYLRHAIGLLSYDFSIELRTLSKSSASSDVEVLRHDPTKLLGEEIETSDRYSLIRLQRSPEEALVFTYKRSAIEHLQKLSNRSPIGFLQIGGTIEWALSHWLKSAAASMTSRNVDVILYDHPTITILQIDDQRVQPNIFCRTDSSGAPPRESAIVHKGLERYLRSGSRVVFFDLTLKNQKAGSSSDGDFAELLRDAIGSEDLTIESQAHPLQLLLTETQS